MSDWSWVQARAQEEIGRLGEVWSLPSVLYRPRIFVDGTAWCCLYGENIQEGVCAFGNTPAEAVYNFDYYAWRGKPAPENAGDP